MDLLLTVLGLVTGTCFLGAAGAGEGFLAGAFLAMLSSSAVYWSHSAAASATAAALLAACARAWGGRRARAGMEGCQCAKGW